MSANQTLCIEGGEELLKLCHAGKLYEVEAWIAAGKPLRLPEVLRKTTLEVAIDLGFHSLVQLLAAHEDSQAVLNLGLALAVDLRSHDIIDLLLKNGAEIRGIPFISVLRSWDLTQHMMKLQVHFAESLLHVHDVFGCHLHQALAVPPE